MVINGQYLRGYPAIYCKLVQVDDPGQTYNGLQRTGPGAGVRKRYKKAKDLANGRGKLYELYTGQRQSRSKSARIPAFKIEGKNAFAESLPNLELARVKRAKMSQINTVLAQFRVY